VWKKQQFASLILSSQLNTGFLGNTLTQGGSLTSIFANYLSQPYLKFSTFYLHLLTLIFQIPFKSMNQPKPRLLRTLCLIALLLGSILTKWWFLCHYLLCLGAFYVHNHALFCLNKGLLRLNGSSGGLQTPLRALFRRTKSQFAGLKESVFRAVGQPALLIKFSNERYKCQFQ